MPDYNCKDIPTLDDVIDDDQSTQTDNLEAAEPVQQVNSEASEHSADTDHTVGNDADNNEDTTDGTRDPLQSSSNSFYPTQGISHSSIQISYQEVYDKLRVQHLSQAGETVAAEAPSIDLDTIVESVTKLIMPELEQQLKSLIQQALTEKLPEEIIKSTHDDSDNSDDDGRSDNV